MNTLIWGGYSRISDDPDDERYGVKRQREDIEEGIAKQGGVFREELLFEENDTSAFKKRKVTIRDEYGEERDAYRVLRPVWAEAMRALRSGKINALMVYDLDRLARDPRDLEDAIEAVERFGAKVVSATSSAINLDTSDGQAWARVMVAMGNKASADTSRRVKRSHLSLARVGAPVGGTRPFGYLRDKVTHDPVEAPLVKQAVEDVLNGSSLRSIAERWESMGVKTVRGKPWDRSVIRGLLANPRLVGWRVHQGKIARDKDGNPVKLVHPATLAALDEHGKPARVKNPRGGEPVEPLIDQDTFDRLQAVLVRPDNRKRKPRHGAHRYLLSGIMRCGLCQGVMYGNYVGETQKGEERFTYGCRGSSDNKHTVAISGHGVDAFMSEVILQHLAETSFEKPEVTFDGDKRLGEIREAITELMTAHREGQLSGAIIFPQVQQLEQEQYKLEAARKEFIRETSGPSTVEITPETWGHMNTDKRRAVISTLVEAILVKPATVRQTTLDTSRLEVIWRR